jgi:hypothetical protein
VSAGAASVLVVASTGIVASTGEAASRTSPPAPPVSLPPAPPVSGRRPPAPPVPGVPPLPPVLELPLPPAESGPLPPLESSPPLPVWPGRGARGDAAGPQLARVRRTKVQAVQLGREGRVGLMGGVLRRGGRIVQPTPSILRRESLTPSGHGGSREALVPGAGAPNSAALAVSACRPSGRSCLRLRRPRRRPARSPTGRRALPWWGRAARGTRPRSRAGWCLRHRRPRRRRGRCPRRR